MRVLQIYLGYACNNLAGVYFTFHKIDTAAKYHLKSLEIMKSLNDSDGLGIVYGNLGELYLAGKDYPKAMSYFQQGILLSEKQNSKYRLANFNAGIGDVYRHTHQ